MSKKKILPKKPMFTQIKRGGIFPSITRKIEYYEFGMYLDWFIRKVICMLHNIKIIGKMETEIPTDTSFYDLYIICMRYYFSEEKDEKEMKGMKEMISADIFFKDMKYYKDIIRFISTNFKKSKNIEIEPEWIFENVMGHPDLVIDNIIYDIKTTGRFNSMRTETIFQLLSYFCIAKNIGKNITGVGLILPAQKKVLVYNLDNWDWQSFWESLKKAVKIKHSLKSTEKDYQFYMKNIQRFVGSHVGKDVTVNRTLISFSPQIPIQMFLAGKKNTTPKIRKSDIEKTLVLANQGYRWYIHAPYSINIAKKYKDQWNIDCIKNFLKLGKEMGCKGIIIQCGISTKEIPEKIALKNMHEFIDKCTEIISSECDCGLFLETPSGKKGGLLTEKKDFVEFVKNHEKLQVCVDTCRVFSAGYKPNKYIKFLVENDISIRLIHLNDSKTMLGSRKDQHVQIGFGYIGLKILNKIGEWAIQNKIDLINE